MLWPQLALLALIVAGGVCLWHRGRVFARRTDALRQAMLHDQSVDRLDVPELPPIVSAFALRAGGQAGGPRAIWLRHRARLATAKGRPPMRIAAEQWLGTRRPGIVWQARGTMGGLPVVVLDSYVGGRGWLSARLAGAFEMASGKGPDYDRGELMRYLSELPLHPDAIVNNAWLHWRQVDAKTVVVSAGSGVGEAKVRFGFDEAGDIVSMRAEDRPMEVGGRKGSRTRPTPWIGKYGNYRQFGSYRIPSYGEVGWLLPDGLFTYWYGVVVDYVPLELELSPLVELDS